MRLDHPPPVIAEVAKEKLKAPNRVQLTFNIAGALLAGVFVVQAILSRDTSGYDLIEFLSGIGIAAAIVFGLWLWLIKGDHHVSFGIVFIWACVFRLIGVWGEPILEDDYFRYLLDACLFISYGSPYGIPPESLFTENSLSPACVELLTGVNNPHLSTIYAPVLQYVFVLSHILSPVNLDLLQFIIVLFDLAVIYMLGKLAPARMVLLYAWCPLVIKEFAFTAHPDVIGVCLLLAAFIFKKHNQTALSCILVGLAICTKIIAVAALPFFLFRQPVRYWLLIPATAVIVYLPFLVGQQQTDLTILAYFAANWQFNAPIFSLLSGVTTDELARYICLATFLIWFGYFFKRHTMLNQTCDIPRMDWVFGVLFLLSPVLNAWYWVWVLPFAVLWPSAWAWTVSVTILLSYIIGLNISGSELGNYQVAFSAQVIQLLSVAVALIFDYRHNRFRMSQSD